MNTMKRVLLGIFGVLLCWLGAIAPALAADMVHGGQVFASNCAACHIGGGNVVNASKTLKISDLEQYEMASIEAIKTQVTKGKSAMPAFLGRLTEDEIDDVAAYVLDQAQKGW
jgi:cytochrome c6